MKNTFRTQQEFDSLFSKHKKFAVLGFPKCGTQALRDHIATKLGKICNSLEIVYRKRGVNVWSHQDNIGYTPIIIYRDPVERIWSAYNYFHYFSKRKKLSFPEFLDYKEDAMQSIGCNDPIACSDYSYYINKWRQVPGCEDLIIVKFEEAREFMEKQNVTANKSKIPIEYEELVLKKLAERNISEI